MSAEACKHPAFGRYSSNVYIFYQLLLLSVPQIAAIWFKDIPAYVHTDTQGFKSVLVLFVATAADFFFNVGCYQL